MYIQVTDNNLTAWGAYPFEGYTRELPFIDYEDYSANPGKYVYANGNITLNPNWEAEQELKEKERIARLSCTKRDLVMMLEQQGIDYFETLEPMINANRQAKLEWQLCEKLYRFNPLLDQLAGSLGITSEQLDIIFRRANGEAV
jgi:hypothetical protein